MAGEAAFWRHRAGVLLAPGVVSSNPWSLFSICHYTHDNVVNVGCERIYAVFFCSTRRKVDAGSHPDQPRMLQDAMAGQASTLTPSKGYNGLSAASRQKAGFSVGLCCAAGIVVEQSRRENKLQLPELRCSCIKYVADWNCVSKPPGGFNAIHFQDWQPLSTRPFHLVIFFFRWADNKTRVRRIVNVSEYPLPGTFRDSNWQ